MKTEKCEVKTQIAKKEEMFVTVIYLDDKSLGLLKPHLSKAIGGIFP